MLGGTAKGSILNSNQITLNGSIAGTATYSMPFQQPAFKEFFINFQSFQDAGVSISFPVVFNCAPNISGDASAVAVASVSTTALTLSATSGITANLFVKGY